MQFKKGRTPWNKGKKTGIEPWNKGKKTSEESREKMSISHIGKQHTLETKQKISKNNARTGWSYSNWEKAGNNSKNFNLFKVYIVKLYNETEEFYKIGKTFLTVKERFRHTSYKVKELVTIYGNAKEMSELEKTIQNKLKNNKYKPKIKFNGAHECFDSLNDKKNNIKI